MLANNQTVIQLRNMSLTLAATLAETAELIAGYNPALARLWIAQPFQRVNIARAFAAGFRRESDDSDPHPAALAVLNVALLDREARA